MPRTASWSARLRSPSLFEALSIGALLLVFFLLAHPYHGIRQDAILYTVQALYNAHPQNFQHDLFFQFGSQDDFSLYGKLYEKLIALIGVRDGNRVGLIGAQLLWWAGIWRVSRTLLPAPWHWIAVLFIAAMPADYGDQFTLNYSELFLTARLPAEALSLWAVSFLLARKPIVAVVTTLFAMAIHPLIGAVGFVVVVTGLMPRAAWWRIFAVALALFVSLQWFAPPSFAVHPLDAAWREVLEREVSFLFPSKWLFLSWSKACWIIALPLVLSVTDKPDRQSFWGRFALLGTAGVSFATVADVWGHDALWIQLQLWRVLWLLTVMQWIAIAMLIRCESRTRPVLVWLLAICWLTLEAGGGFVALLIAGVMLFDRMRVARGAAVERFQKLTPMCKRSLIGATVLAVMWWFAVQDTFNLSRIPYDTSSYTLHLPLLDMFFKTKLMGLIAGMLATTYLYRTKRSAPVFYAMLVVLGAYAVINMDQRSPTMKLMEQNLDAPRLAPFAAEVRAGQTIYWDGESEEIVYPWLLMRTASYFSPAQSAGIVFHRQTTFEALHRADVIRQGEGLPSKPVDGNVSQQSLLFRGGERHTPLTMRGIASVCQTPYLDFIISPVHYLALPTSGEWAPNDHLRYWLYDCKQVDAVSSQSALAPMPK